MDGYYSQAPEAGMTFKPEGTSKTIIFMTGTNGNLILDIRNKTFEMGYRSVLRLRGANAPERVTYKSDFYSLKLFVGRIWAKISGPQPLEKYIPNATSLGILATEPEYE